MKLLRIKDNSQYKRDSFDEIKNLTGKIADKTLEQLEREGVFVFPEFVIDADDITKPANKKSRGNRRKFRNWFWVSQIGHL